MNKKILGRVTRSPMLAVVLVLVLAGTALATVASNFSPALQSRGTIGESFHINTDGIKLQSKGAIDIVQATVAIGAPGSSGWHSHPGIVLVTVVAGSLTVYDANCVATVQAAGSAFVEAGDSPLLVRNESQTVSAMVRVTYLEPAGTPNAGLRIDAANPGCPQS
jgi:quercetin dioxygenase-like cupin family protein